MAIQTSKSTNSAGSRKHFTKLQAMLREGQLAPGPRGRRYLPGQPAEGNLSWEKMAELGNQSRLPAGLRRIRSNG
jgi:hypothetical protein